MIDSNPNMEARRESNDRYLDLVRERRWWQAVAGAESLLVLMLPSAFGRLSLQHKTVSLHRRGRVARRRARNQTCRARRPSERRARDPLSSSPPSPAVPARSWRIASRWSRGSTTCMRTPAARAHLLRRPLPRKQPVRDREDVPGRPGRDKPASRLGPLLAGALDRGAPWTWRPPPREVSLGGGPQQPLPLDVPQCPPALGHQRGRPAEPDAGLRAQLPGPDGGERPRRRRRPAIAPTLEVRPGYPFNVLVTQDVVFPGPYDDARQP